MSMYDSLYGREGRGIGPNEPEKKGFARFCQMVGRDLGQLLGTNLLVCLLCLPAALGVSLGVTLLSLPLTIVLGAATGLLAGLAGLLLAECCLRSLQNDPSQWLPCRWKPRRMLPFLPCCAGPENCFWPHRAAASPPG